MEQSSIYIHLYNDLCERIPYRPLVEYEGYVMNLIGYEDGRWVLQQHIERTIHTIKTRCIENIKPYLRPMDSMTDAERRSYEWTMLHCSTSISDNIMLFEWLNARHFDYRGLIGKGLALEAPEGMYNTKN